MNYLKGSKKEGWERVLPRVRVYRGGPKRRRGRKNQMEALSLTFRLASDAWLNDDDFNRRWYGTVTVMVATKSRSRIYLISPSVLP